MEQLSTEARGRALERGIERDRHDIDRTLTELKERFTVGHLVEQTRQHLAGAFQLSAEVLRQHPIPMGAAAVLATGALVGRSRARSRQQARMMNGLRLRALLEETLRRDGSVKDAAKDVWKSAAHVAPESLSNAARVASDLVRDGERRIQSGIETLNDRQPGLLNALAMLIGGALMVAMSRRS